MTNENEADNEFQDELEPGTKLLGDQYTITKFLNSGGFGITYLAKDSLDRDVVIKECFPESICRRNDEDVRPRSRAHQSSFGSVVELFVKEARNQAKLTHPNIASVHQVFNDNGTAYMAIDFIDGKDMLDTIEDRSVVTPANVEHWLRKTLDAVGFIHNNSMLHRDISPDNILINSKNEPILIDFGAARENASQSERALSTLRVVKDGYSPQEFYVQGSEQTPSSDLYALAATFYHVVSGEAPRDSQARLAAIAQGEGDLYQPLAGNHPDFPDSLLKSIDKALSVLPVDRFPQAADWLAVLDGQKIQKARSRVINNAPKTGAESKSKTGLIVALLGGVSAAALAAFFMLGTGAKDVQQDQEKVTATETPAETVDTPETEVSDVKPSETALDDTPESEVVEAEPTPAVDPAVAMMEIRSKLVEDKNWIVNLPFHTLPSPQPEGTFAMVVSADDSLKENGIDWLQTGTVIYSVNDNLVADNKTISKAVQADQSLEGRGELPAEFRVRTSTGDDVTTHSMSFNVGFETKMRNGLRFVATLDDGAWVTKAVRVPDALNSGLKVGDIIRSEAVSQVALIGPDDLDTVLQKIEDSGSAFLTVSRGGILKSVNLSLE